MEFSATIITTCHSGQKIGCRKNKRSLKALVYYERQYDMPNLKGLTDDQKERKLTILCAYQVLHECINENVVFEEEDFEYEYENEDEVYPDGPEEAEINTEPN